MTTRIRECLPPFGVAPSSIKDSFSASRAQADGNIELERSHQSQNLFNFDNIDMKLRANREMEDAFEARLAASAASGQPPPAGPQWLRGASESSREASPRIDKNRIAA